MPAAGMDDEIKGLVRSFVQLNKMISSAQGAKAWQGFVLPDVPEAAERFIGKFQGHRMDVFSDSKSGRYLLTNHGVQLLKFRLLLIYSNFPH